MLSLFRSQVGSRASIPSGAALLLSNCLSWMAVVTRAAEGFAPEHIGKALAHSWNVNGLTLQLVDVLDHQGVGATCPITHEPMTNLGMAADGFVYQMGWIMTWLDEHDRSPLTNLELPHCLLYTSPSPRDKRQSRMPSSA